MIRAGLRIPNFTYRGVPDIELFEKVSDLATTAEASGFDTVLVMDHFYQLPGLGTPDARCSRRTRSSARSRAAPSGCNSAPSSPA